MSDQTNQTTYDEIPYPSLPYLQSHPNRLATNATLLGMTPPPVEQCRVLELGCAGGGNLIPMAYGLPQAQFIGIDFAARQIEQGQATVDALQLDNISLKQMDLKDVQPDFGQFDYIIAHGLYSWIPPDIQEKMLQICKQNLAPNGIAYVSYNTYPGWGMLNMVREMMLYHTRHFSEPHTRIEQAQALLDLLIRAVPADSSAYGSFLKAYVDVRVKEREEGYQDSGAFLFHDELEAHNYPVYFHQFAEHARQHDLQYLGEAVFANMTPTGLPSDVIQDLERMSTTLIDYEQYMDFLHNRTFRRTLLCHRDMDVSRKLRPDRLLRMHIASAAMPDSSEPDIAGNTVETFKAADKSVFSTDHPVTKAAMLFLGEVWPQTVPFEGLLNQARSIAAAGQDIDNSPEKTARDAEVLATNLLMAYTQSAQLLELHVHPPRFATDISQRPLASPVARRQIEQNAVKITNLRHERVKLDLFQRYVMQNLDGNHSLPELIEALAELVEMGQFSLKRKAQPVEDPQQIREMLTSLVQHTLPQLARQALLVA